MNRYSGRKRQVFERDNGTCLYCGLLATTIDHVIPQARGGSWHITNLVASCQECNQAKGDFPLVEFLIHRARYLYDRGQYIAEVLVRVRGALGFVQEMPRYFRVMQRDGQCCQLCKERMADNISLRGQPLRALTDDDFLATCRECRNWRDLRQGKGKRRILHGVSHVA